MSNNTKSNIRSIITHVTEAIGAQSHIGFYHVFVFISTVIGIDSLYHADVPLSNKQTGAVH